MKMSVLEEWTVQQAARAGHCTQHCTQYTAWLPCSSRQLSVVSILTTTTHWALQVRHCWGVRCVNSGTVISWQWGQWLVQVPAVGGQCRGDHCQWAGAGGTRGQYLARAQLATLTRLVLGGGEREQTLSSLAVATRPVNDITTTNYRLVITKQRGIGTGDRMWGWGAA